MKPFNPEKAQFYYDTASSFQDALVKSSNQLLEYEDKIRTLKNENDELKKQVDSLVSNLAAAHEDRNEEAKSVFLAKQVEIPELLRENAALRMDKERLDWLEHQANFSFGRCLAAPEDADSPAFALSVGLHNHKRKFSASSLRAAIDAARKAQP